MAISYSGNAIGHVESLFNRLSLDRTGFTFIGAMWSGSDSLPSSLCTSSQALCALSYQVFLSPSEWRTMMFISSPWSVSPRAVDGPFLVAYTSASSDHEVTAQALP